MQINFIAQLVERHSEIVKAMDSNPEDSNEIQILTGCITFGETDKSTGPFISHIN